MRVRLEDIREQPFRWHEERAVDASEVGHPDVMQLGPVDWRGTLAYTEPSFLLSVSFSYQQTLACIRCLRPIIEPVKGQLQVVVIEEPEPAEEGEHALLEEDLSILHAPSGEIDLDELLVEQIALNVPMSQLCRPDCPGLCPKCGTDLAEGACACGTEEADPRWEALRHMRARFTRGD
jgi:uncharacterized protein